MNEIIFQTENITKSYKQVHVLDHVNMTVKRGEIYGLIWENNVDPLVNRTGQAYFGNVALIRLSGENHRGAAIANGLHYRRTFFVSGDDRNGKLRGSAAAAGNPWKRKS